AHASTSTRCARLNRRVTGGASWRTRVAADLALRRASRPLPATVSAATVAAAVSDVWPGEHESVVTVAQGVGAGHQPVTAPGGDTVAFVALGAALADGEVHTVEAHPVLMRIGRHAFDEAMPDPGEIEPPLPALFGAVAGTGDADHGLLTHHGVAAMAAVDG